MSEQETPEVVTEETAVDYDSPEYINSVIDDFKDQLGFGEKQESAPAPTEEETKTEPEPEQTGDTDTPDEAVETAPEEVVPKDQSQVIAEKAEAEAKARESAKQAEADRLAAIEAAKKEALDSAFKAIRVDPQRWLTENAEAMGIDVGEFAMHAYRVALGDDAPPELVKRTSKGPDAVLSEVERRFEEMRAENEQKVREAELRATAASYEAYLPTVTEGHFKAVYDKNPDTAKQHLFNIADQLASQNNGQYPSPDKVINEYNRQVEEIFKLHERTSTPEPAQPSSPPAQTETATKPKTTLSDDMSDRASAHEYTDPDLDDEALIKDALQYLEENPLSPT